LQHHLKAKSDSITSIASIPNMTSCDSSDNVNRDFHIWHCCISIYGILFQLIWIYDWYSYFIGKLVIGAFISLSGIISINGLTMILENIWRVILRNTTMSDMKVAIYIIAWIAACHIRNRGNTSDTVWFGFQIVLQKSLK
jgi:hypothetical protein